MPIAVKKPYFTIIGASTAFIKVDAVAASPLRRKLKYSQTLHWTRSGTAEARLESSMLYELKPGMTIFPPAVPRV